MVRRMVSMGGVDRTMPALIGEPLRLMLLVCFCTLSFLQVGFGQERPNIVFLLADDMGYADAACMGHPYAKTPAIDQLAREGTLFRTYYSAAPTCVPSRFGLLTGRFPGSLKNQNIDNTRLEHSMTIPAMLKQHGYTTGHFGKWGLGRRDSNASIGLDEIEELRGESNDLRGRDAGIADATIHFIQENQSTPFFVNVWFHTPHHPVAPDSQYSDRFSNQVFDPRVFANPEFTTYLETYERECGPIPQGFSNYLGDISQLDDQIGRILKCIEDAGIKNRTIVIFSSDNGPARLQSKTEVEQRSPEPRSRIKKKNSGSPEFESKEHSLGFAGPFRGGKHTIFEGGIRTPWIVRWPGRVPAGRVDESSVISAVDLLPTLATLVGSPTHGEHVDGEDVSSIWFGNATPRQRELYWQSSSPLGPKHAVRRGRWKLCEFSKTQVALFDLERDPAEQTNLADANPAVVSELKLLLKKRKGAHPLKEDGPKTDSLRSTTRWITGPKLAIPAGLSLAVVFGLWCYRKRWQMHIP